MAKVLDYIVLARPYQWYKNLIVFLAIFFAEGIFNGSYLKAAILAFIALSLASSSNYVINDIIDRKRDRLNPLKRKRPITNGSISILEGIIFALLLMISSLLISSYINIYFTFLVVSLFILTQFYSLWMKRQVLLDIIALSANFVIRAAAGAFAIGVSISPWLILAPFFLALLLAAGKRKGELHIPGNDIRSRIVLAYYSDKILDNIIVISSTLFMISYGLFSFLSIHRYLIFSLPLAIYVTLRYQMIIETEKIAVSPELSITDLPLMTGIILWAALSAVLVYF